MTTGGRAGEDPPDGAPANPFRPGPAGAVEGGRSEMPGATGEELCADARPASTTIAMAAMKRRIPMKRVRADRVEAQC